MLFRSTPFDFTGNKFEFGMVGSSQSIASCNFTLNTIVAEVLNQFADSLEKSEEFDKDVQKLLVEVIKNHKRVIFNGNGYSEEWVLEAEKRGLPNIRSTVAAIPAIIAEKNVIIFEKHKVLSKIELESRYEINLEAYIKAINIEALAMLEIAKRQIQPACIAFATELAGSINTINATGIKVNTSVQEELLVKVSNLIASLSKNTAKLEKVNDKANNLHGDAFKQASFFRDEVFTQMAKLRADADELETVVDSELWPLPTYGEMLFNV